MRLLVTRPQPEATGFAAELRAAGMIPVIAPLLVIEPGDPCPDLASDAALVATSANGVRALAPATDRRDQPLFVVGPRTAELAREAGFSDVTAASGDVTDLGRRIADRLPVGARLVWVRGRDVVQPASAWLPPGRFAVSEWLAYRAEAVEALPDEAAQALGAGQIDGVTFFSRRTATIFQRLVAQAGLTEYLTGCIAWCLSPAIAERLDPARWHALRTPARPDGAALIERIRKEGGR